MTSQRQQSVERLIHAPADKIFAILTDLDQHAVIDGSGMVQGAPEGPRPLVHGSRFTMAQSQGKASYRSNNQVLEYEKDRLIAWETFAEFRGTRVFGGHRWRYELEPREDSTLVRETYDWNEARLPQMYSLAGFNRRYLPAMERTLERLAAVAEGRDPRA